MSEMAPGYRTPHRLDTIVSLGGDFETHPSDTWWNDLSSEA